MAEHRYPERTVASPKDRITVGQRVHVWFGFGTSPGTAWDRLSAAIEGVAEVRALLGGKVR